MTELLIPRGFTDIPSLARRLYLRREFQYKPTLFPFKGLRKRVRTLRDDKPSDGAHVALCDLATSAYDRQFDLRPKHKLTLWHVGYLISKQRKGQEGPLLTNGMANIFPLRSCVVWLFWVQVPTPQGMQGKWWGVDVESYDTVLWYKGSRLFKRA